VLGEGARLLAVVAGLFGPFLAGGIAVARILASAPEAAGRLYAADLAGAALGAAIAVGTLMPLSLITSSGINGYKAFIFNTRKHKETPLTNHMGLRTVVTYSPSEAGRSLQDSRDEDPWGKWKRAKVATFNRRFPLYLLFAAGFAALLFASLRKTEPWVACAMGSMMIAVGVELTCYYYSMYIVAAVLVEQRKELAPVILAVSGASQILLLNYYWVDDKYTAQSWLFFAFSLLILYSYSRPFSMERLKACDFELCDGQVPTPHLMSLGAEEVPRAEFLRRLRRALQRPARLS